MPKADMYGVPDVSRWVPDFRAGYDQLRAQAGRLKALRGRRIAGTWVVLGTSGSHERWWNDLPVILQFADGQQLEVCWDFRDRVSISWNTIDVSVTPGRWMDYSLTWQRDGQPALSGVTGSVLTEVSGMEQAYWRGVDIIDPGNPGITAAAGWDARGIWLQTSQADVRIYSGVDGNGLSNEEPPGAWKDWRLLTLLPAAGNSGWLCWSGGGTAGVRTAGAWRRSRCQKGARRLPRNCVTWQPRSDPTLRRRS